MKTYFRVATHRLRTCGVNVKAQEEKDRPQYHHVTATKIDTLFPAISHMLDGRSGEEQEGNVRITYH
jgi:hypothetical protein